jgi:hypothetical protein
MASITSFTLRKFHFQGVIASRLRGCGDRSSTPFRFCGWCTRFLCLRSFVRFLVISSDRQLTYCRHTATHESGLVSARRNLLFFSICRRSITKNSKQPKQVGALSEVFMLDIVLVGLIVLFFSIAIGYVHFLDRLKGKTVQRQSH